MSKENSNFQQPLFTHFKKFIHKTDILIIMVSIYFLPFDFILYIQFALDSLHTLKHNFPMLGLYQNPSIKIGII